MDPNSALYVTRLYAEGIPRIKRVKIQNINFDFIPTSVAGRKVLWVDLGKLGVPGDLRVNSRVRLFVSNYNFGENTFYVTNISGTRVSLESEYYAPRNHSDKWGYSTKIVNESPFNHTDFTFGFGRSDSYLEYAA